MGKRISLFQVGIFLKKYFCTEFLGFRPFLGRLEKQVAAAGGQLLSRVAIFKDCGDVVPVFKFGIFFGVSFLVYGIPVV